MRGMIEMGFFSYLCKECGITISNSYRSLKLSKVVAITYDNLNIIGYYDGYGRVNGYDLMSDGRTGKHDFIDFVNSKEEFRNTLEQNKDNQGWLEYDKYFESGKTIDELVDEFDSKVPALYHAGCFNEDLHSKYNGGSVSCPYQGYFMSDEEIKQYENELNLNELQDQRQTKCYEH